MFPFIITYRRKTKIQEEIETDSFFMEIRNLLKKRHGIKKTKTIGNKINFNIDFMRGVSNWDLFGTVDKAEIFIDSKTLTYKISILKFVIIILFMALFAASFITFSSSMQNKVETFFPIFTFVIVFLGGFNLVITLIRHYYYSNELVQILQKNQSK